MTLDRTIEYRYDNVVAGEKRMELQVVPPFAVTLSTDIAVIPRAAVTTNGERGPSAAGRRIDVTVIGQAKNGASATVSLQVPAGWQVQPVERTGEVHARGRVEHDAVRRHAAGTCRDRRLHRQGVG